MHDVRLVFTSTVCTVTLFLTSMCITTTDCDLQNSTLACTRGTQKTNHHIKCNRLGPKNTGIILINKVFYGTLPKTRGCSISAPYDNCCGRDASGEECVFEDDNQLNGFKRYCSSASTCEPTARAMNPIGHCNQTHFPSLTSFSFVEYDCVRTQDLKNICKNNKMFSTKGQLFLDSNHVNSNNKLSDQVCQCMIISECGQSLNFTNMDVRLTDDKNGTCAEELYFSEPTDNHNSSKHYTCHDQGDLLPDDFMFSSQSNAVNMTLKITGAHIGSLFIKVTSSDPNGEIKLVCGDDDISISKSQTGCLEVEESKSTIPTLNMGDASATVPPQNVTKSRPDIDESQPAKDKTSHFELDPGQIVGLVLAIVAIILAVLLAFVIGSWYRKKADQREDDRDSGGYDNLDILDTPSVYSIDLSDGYAMSLEPVYEETPIDVLSKKSLFTPTSFVNPVCDSDDSEDDHSYSDPGFTK